MVYSSRLQQLRKAKGFTLQQVADILGCTPTSINLYEKGKRQPSLERLKQLADLYDTTTDDIAGHTTESDNLKRLLNSNKLHWDGVPIQDTELKLIQDLLFQLVGNRSNETKKNGTA